MKTVAPRVSVSIAIFSFSGGAAIAIANAAGRLKDFGWAVIPLFSISAVALTYALYTAFLAPQQEPVPPIISVDRYATSKLGNTIHSRGYQIGEPGLVVVNDRDEAAYEIGVHPPFILLGDTKSKLHFSNTISRLTKGGAAQLNTWIERAGGGIISGGDLFDFMREHEIDSVEVPVNYKSGSNHWYKCRCTIERDVNIAGGLGVKSEFSGRAKKPK